jgi:hypothetical protein
MRWILLSLPVMTLSVITFSVITMFAATPLLRSTFDNGPGAWITMGENGTLRVAREAADIRESNPSLAFDYEIGPKKFGAAILPVEPGALAAMDQVHFWVKTDYPTSVAMILSEKGGGNYSATAWSPGGVWQEVRVQPRDFALNDRASDPPDPDGKLDLDQLQGIGLADLGQLFGGAAPNPNMPIVMTSRPGKHTLLVSGFEVLGGNGGHKDKLVIDQFDAPQLSWMTPGGAAFRLDSSRDHAPGPAIEVSYTEAENAIVVFVRSLPPDVPANITHISFDIASEKPAQLAFALQEKGAGRGEGPRYNTIVEVKGGGKSDHRELALSAFTLDQNGPPDPYDGLKVAKAKSLSIADISAAANAAHGPNKVWISDLRLTARE